MAGGIKYTLDEDKRLYEMFSNSEDLGDIAGKMHRPILSVAWRMMNLSKKNPDDWNPEQMQTYWYQAKRLTGTTGKEKAKQKKIAGFSGKEMKKLEKMVSEKKPLAEISNRFEKDEQKILRGIKALPAKYPGKYNEGIAEHYGREHNVNRRRDGKSPHYTRGETLAIYHLFYTDVELERMSEIMSVPAAGIGQKILFEAEKDPKTWDYEKAVKYGNRGWLLDRITKRNKKTSRKEADCVERALRAKYIGRGVEKELCTIMKDESLPEKEREEAKFRIFELMEPLIEKNTRKRLFFLEHGGPVCLDENYELIHVEDIDFSMPGSSDCHAEEDIIQDMKMESLKHLIYFNPEYEKAQNISPYTAGVVFKHLYHGLADSFFNTHVPTHIARQYIIEMSHENVKNKHTISEMTAHLHRLKEVSGDKQFDISQMVDEQSCFADDFGTCGFSLQFEDSQDIPRNTEFFEYLMDAMNAFAERIPGTEYQRLLFREKYLNQETGPQTLEAIAKTLGKADRRTVWGTLKKFETRFWEIFRGSKEYVSLKDDAQDILESMQDKERIFTLS